MARPETLDVVMEPETKKISPDKRRTQKATAVVEPKAREVTAKRQVDPLVEPDGSRRMSITLSAEAVEALQWIAETRSCSFADVFRRALGTQRFLERECRQKRGRLYLEVPGEKMKEIVLL